MTREVKKAEFQDAVIEASSTKPVLVDFYAPWCMPCRMMAPVLEELSQVMGDKASVIKVNVEEERELGSLYGIMSIPTMYLFRNGEIVEKIVGLQPIENLKTLFEQYK